MGIRPIRMKLLVLFLLFYCVQFPVRAEHAKSAKSFLSFCGLNYGDDIDTVRKKLGRPQRITDNFNPFTDTRYFYFLTQEDDWGGLEIHFDHRRGNKVCIVALLTADAVEGLKTLGVRDAKADLYGKKDKAIISALGKPSSHDSGFVDYDDYDDSLTVSFDCNGLGLEDPHGCCEIRVQWMYQ